MTVHITDYSAVGDDDLLMRLRNIDSLRLLAAVRVIGESGAIEPPTPFHLQCARIACSRSDVAAPVGASPESLWNAWVASLADGAATAEVHHRTECTFVHHRSDRCDRCEGVGTLVVRLVVSALQV